MRAILKDVRGRRARIRIGGLMQDRVDLLEIRCNQWDEVELQLPRFRIGHQRISVRQILIRVAPAQAGRYRIQQSVIFALNRTRKRDIARRIGVILNVRLPAFFNPDVEDRARTIATNRFHARRRDARDLVQLIFEIAARGNRIARIQRNRAQNFVLGNVMRSKYFDQADARRDVFGRTQLCTHGGRED